MMLLNVIINIQNEINYFKDIKILNLIFKILNLILYFLFLKLYK